MRFDLKTPCKSCPFLRTQRGFLHLARAAEIMGGITDGDGTFGCHMSVEYDDDYDGDENGEGAGQGRVGPNTQHCAGASIFLTKQRMPNQLMRIAQRLGYFDPHALDLSAEVFDREEEFLLHHAEERQWVRSPSP